MTFIKKQKSSPVGIEKVLTGIKGFDEITYGGLPKGRPTLICGSAGCGKTLMALEILVHGAVLYNEPGVFLAFEETKDDIIKNVASLGFDLEDLERRKLIYIDYVYVDTQGYTETGEYNLDGLFIRLDCAVRAIGAKRVVIDTMEVLFSGFANQGLLRAELRRLFLWLKHNNLTTVVTGEQGPTAGLTRHGIEEYVADCVIYLSHNVLEELYTRRLQIIKYRGSYHETNQFPFLITKRGISILPITTLQMDCLASHKRISSGIPELDNIMDGQGYYEGSSILISGASGSGKTSFAGAFANEICKRKQKCIFFSYEESEEEIKRNLSSIGMKNVQNTKDGYLKIVATRPTQWGLEKHLGIYLQAIDEFKPNAVIIDPISTLSHCGTETQVYSVLSRMIDYSKTRNITLFMTILCMTSKGKDFTFGISSIIDTWIALRNDESNGELNRELLITKSRGMKHSNQVREFTLTSNGIIIKEPYYGESGVLTGSSRVIQEHKDLIEEAENESKLKRMHDEIELKRKLIEMQIESLNIEIEAKVREVKEKERLLHFKEKIHNQNKSELEKIRSLDKVTKTSKGAGNGKKRKN